MTELDEYVIRIVEDKAPIKAVDLAVEIATHRHGVAEKDITETLNRLVAAGMIKEVEYVLPKMSYRVKSMYFPEGSSIKVVGS
jgi:DNA-binding HxlR family transcriptional regulator